jgi:CRP-like cAMP-binding protein
VKNRFQSLPFKFNLQRYAAEGERFTREGDPADKMFIIRSGMVRLTVGKEELRSSPMKGGGKPFCV